MGTTVSEDFLIFIDYVFDVLERVFVLINSNWILTLAVLIIFVNYAISVFKDISGNSDDDNSSKK